MEETVQHPRVKIVVSGNFDIFSFIIKQLNEINRKKGKFLKYFPGTMHDQEEFCRQCKVAKEWG